MFGKKFVLIFSSLLAIAMSFNAAKALSDVEKAYYKEHPDVFVKKVFLDEPNEKLSQPKQVFFNLLAYLIPAGICAELFGSEYYIIRSLIIANIVGCLCLWYYHNRSKTAINKDTLLSFLRQYQATTQSSTKEIQLPLGLIEENNLKHYLPKNLQVTFDTLSNRINTLGADSFTDEEVNSLMRSLQAEIYKDFPSDHDQKNNQTLIICATAITLTLINYLLFAKIDRSLHILQDDINYWGIRYNHFNDPRRIHNDV